MLCGFVFSLEVGSGFSELGFSLLFVVFVVCFGTVAVVVGWVSLEKFAMYSEGTLATTSSLFFWLLAIAWQRKVATSERVASWLGLSSLTFG